MTYVYCVVQSAKPPRLRGVRNGLAGMGRPRLLPIDRSLFAVVSSAPPGRYGEAAINRELSNIDWVSRVAVAHERVVEHFVGATALLPMKLFTLFASDDRAREYFHGERPRLVAAARRVKHQQEWGVRVLMDRARTAATKVPSERRTRGGVAYLERKKVQRDAVTELAVRAHDTVTGLYERLAAKGRDARRRSASELPAQGSLLLDAAFLVPRARAAAFRTLVARESRALAPHGYSVTLTGPWPPYTFVQER